VPAAPPAPCPPAPSSPLPTRALWSGALCCCPPALWPEAAVAAVLGTKSSCKCRCSSIIVHATQGQYSLSCHKADGRSGHRCPFGGRCSHFLPNTDCFTMARGIPLALVGALLLAAGLCCNAVRPLVRPGRLALCGYRCCGLCSRQSQPLDFKMGRVIRQQQASRCLGAHFSISVPWSAGPSGRRNSCSR
jgi:hypothetical protein